MYRSEFTYEPCIVSNVIFWFRKEAPFYSWTEICLRFIGSGYPSNNQLLELLESKMFCEFSLYALNV